MMFSLAPAKHRPCSWTTLRIQIQNSGPPRSIATSLLRHCRQSACVSAHAVAMFLSYSVVSAEVDHPGATVPKSICVFWQLLAGFCTNEQKYQEKSTFKPYIRTALVFEKKKDQLSSSSLCLTAKLGRARLLLFHLYWDDLLIVGLLMAYFDVRMARRKRLASVAATKKATPSRAPRERARG